MLERLRTYRLVLIFCLLLIGIVAGSSITKIKNHRTNAFNSGSIEVTVNQEETETNNDDTDYYNPDAESITPDFYYEGYYERHPEALIGEDVPEDVEPSDDTLAVQEARMISEEDFKEILEVIQSTSDKEYNGSFITDNMQESIKNHSLQISGYEDITANNIEIMNLGIAEDGEYTGRVKFSQPSERIFNIEGFIVNGQIDSMQIF